MDSQRDNSTTEKHQTEVVLVIAGEDGELQVAPPHPPPPPQASSQYHDAEVESSDEAPEEQRDRDPRSEPNNLPFLAAGIASPEISIRPICTPRTKPPSPPPSETVLRHRSITKPKSRFVEQPLPPAAADFTSGSPNPRAGPCTPRTPVAAGDQDEEEQDEEICKRAEQSNGKRRRKWKVRVWIEWAILVLATVCLVTSLALHRLQGVVIRGLEIWKWCLMVTVICCGRLVTQWFITALVFLVERNFLLEKKALYFVYGLKKSVQVCIWVGLVLLSWSLVFNQGVTRTPHTEKILGYVSRLLVSLLIGSVMWLVKTLLLKILASSFHMNRFFDRIQESLFHQYVLQTLSGPPVMELMAEEAGGAAKGPGQLSFRSMGKWRGKWEERGVIDVAKLHKMNQEKVSASTLKWLINVIGSTGLSTISNTIDESYSEEGGQQKDSEINNERDAKAAAHRIFKNVAKPGHKYIDVEDLLRFLSKEEVEFVLPLFEGAAESGRIKKSALRNWVVKAYLDRKSLAHSLNDTKTAVNQLHKLATVIVSIVIIIISLLVMGFATTQVLVLISSQLLVVAFMFGNTCKTAFEAIIFVFVMHPFDVGDRCVVDGVQMIVEEMNILTTVFLRYDNEKIYYPNSVLSTKPISNFYRSPQMGDSVEFSVDISTSVESIGVLKSKIRAYIDSKPNHWHANHSIIVKDIVNGSKMKMALYVHHTMNYQNIGEKNSRRSELVLELKKIFEELSIRYHLLPQEVHLSYTGSTPLPMIINQSV